VIENKFMSILPEYWAKQKYSSACC